MILFHFVKKMVLVLVCHMYFGMNKPFMAQTGVSDELIHSTNRRRHA